MVSTILACAANEFQKSRKMWYFKKCVNNLPLLKCHVYGVILSRLDQRTIIKHGDSNSDVLICFDNKFKT